MKPVAKPMKIARVRLLIVAALMLAFYGVIGFSLIKVSLWHNTDKRGTRTITDIQEELANSAEATGPKTFARAEIRDRNGQLLATTLRMASVFADPEEIIDAREATEKLLPFLPKETESSLHKKLTHKGRFVWLKRNITPREQYEINRLGIPGIDFRYETRRVYPNDHLVSHIVGYTDRDEHGIAGMEKTFDKELVAHPEPLFLSIDNRVQHIMRREVMHAVEYFNAIGGVGMMMNVKTGEIVAMVSVPDFNPNQPGKVEGIGENNPRFNRAALGVYEMGSTFKSLTTAIALDSGKVKMFDTFDARAPISIGRFTIDDYKPERKVMTVPQVFVYSSNIGTVKIAQKVGTEMFKQFLTDLGMMQATPLEIPEAGKPIVPNPWREISTMTIAFGHGMAVSAAQLLRAEAAMVNGGILVEPTLIKKQHFGPPQGERVIKKETSDRMRELLRLNVIAGTGGKAAAEGYVVGGKTGTTEKAVAGGYNKGKLISSFIGSFPMDNPEYVILVMVDEPKGRKETYGYATGGWVAAPVVKNVVAGAAPILGIAPRNEQDPQLIQSLTIPGMNLEEFIESTKGH